MKNKRGGRRVLAIDPTHRGFGFVVFEGPENLLDWGLRVVHGPKNDQSIAIAKRLLEFHRPEVLVFEDVSAKGCHRRSRVHDLLDAIGKLAEQNGIRVRRISRLKAQEVFGRLGAVNKNQVARLIAARHPELARHLPLNRSPWMSEDLRMPIFDAAGFALVSILGREAYKPPP